MDTQPSPTRIKRRYSPSQGINNQKRRRPSSSQKERRKTKWMSEPRLSKMREGIRLVRIAGLSVDIAAKAAGLPERTLRRYTEISQDPSRADSMFYFPLRPGERILKRSLRARVANGEISYGVPKKPTTVLGKCKTQSSADSEPSPLLSLRLLPSPPLRLSPAFVYNTYEKSYGLPADNESHVDDLLESFNQDRSDVPMPLAPLSSRITSDISIGSDFFSLGYGEQDLARTESSGFLTPPPLIRVASGTILLPQISDCRATDGFDNKQVWDDACDIIL